VRVLAALIGAALGAGLVGANAFLEAHDDSRLMTVGPGWTCVPGSGSSCILAPAGTNGSLRPVSSWCNVTYDYWHGQVSGETVNCSGSPEVLSFNETETVVLSGTFSVSGPFQIWILPAADGCFLGSDLEQAYTHLAPDCAVPRGPIPSYSWWNMSVPNGGSVDLASLTFDFGSSPGVLPPALWSIEIVATGGTADIWHVQTALAVSPV
jgi:hypothetical protein